MPRVLVTGAGGQLGHDVVATAEGAGDDVLGLAHHDLDVTDRSGVIAAVTVMAPRRRDPLRSVDCRRRL